jgi:hypothetical protein
MPKRGSRRRRRAELLRLGENAIYQLAAAQVVVRITRSGDLLRRAEKELCVARWLAAANVPAVRVYEEIDQPLLVDGRPVSFWHAVTGGDPAPTMRIWPACSRHSTGWATARVSCPASIRSGSRTPASPRRAGSPPGTVASCGPAAAK